MLLVLSSSSSSFSPLDGAFLLSKGAIMEELIKDNRNIKSTKVTLAGKTYEDITYTDKPVGNAYIQCSWFDDKQMKFMEEGLKAIGQNPTVSLGYSHHPLSHQYKNINVNDHPEVMDDLEWQSSTYLMDVTAMNRSSFGIGLYLPSDEDSGQAFEQGFLNACHKPNIIVIPDEEKDIPLNLMIGKGNTDIILLSRLSTYNFNDIIYKPYKGKVF